MIKLSGIDNDRITAAGTLLEEGMLLEPGGECREPLLQQLKYVVLLANAAGCYDAADWITRTLASDSLYLPDGTGSIDALIFAACRSLRSGGQRQDEWLTQLRDVGALAVAAGCNAAADWISGFLLSKSRPGRPVHIP